MKMAESLSYDWISKNLYFTDYQVYISRSLLKMFYFEVFVQMVNSAVIILKHYKIYWECSNIYNIIFDF